MAPLAYEGVEAVICPFCTYVIEGHDRPLLVDEELILAFEDAYPSAPGHTLVIPRRHVGRLVDLTHVEYWLMWQVARYQLRRLELTAPDGYTIGINDGEAAGQTVEHVHLHIIPRHHGDTAESRGGIRWAIPETAPYWQAAR